MILWLVSVIQIILASRVVLRLLRTGGGQRVENRHVQDSARVSIIVPVLNEAARIETCLEGLIRQPEEVTEILVVDGGSSDGTQSIIERWRRRHNRLRLIDASPVDESWTGKAWGLYVGLQSARPQSEWILCIDADVRCSSTLVPALLYHAKRTGNATFSIATMQKLSGRAEALIHPSLLTTLIYRFGVPGKSTDNLHQVQANGQCFLSRKETLLRTNAFCAAKMSLCEDITVARRLAECREKVGFYETDGLAQVTMYSSWREAWRNWPRSLAMRDQYFGWREMIGMGEVLMTQALPLPFFIIGLTLGAPFWLLAPNLSLVMIRMGILVGVARAYAPRPWTYWLSPLLDVPAALRLFASAFMRKQAWRGRVYLRRSGGKFEVFDTSEAASQ